jgi:hypothetical protein
MTQKRKQLSGLFPYALPSRFQFTLNQVTRGHGSSTPRTPGPTSP